jgi:hypothetical protein
VFIHINPSDLFSPVFPRGLFAGAAVAAALQVRRVPQVKISIEVSSAPFPWILFNLPEIQEAIHMRVLP